MASSAQGLSCASVDANWRSAGTPQGSAPGCNHPTRRLRGKPVQQTSHVPSTSVDGDCYPVVTSRPPLRNSKDARLCIKLATADIPGQQHLTARESGYWRHRRCRNFAGVDDLAAYSSCSVSQKGFGTTSGRQSRSALVHKRGARTRGPLLVREAEEFRTTSRTGRGDHDILRRIKMCGSVAHYESP